MFTAFEASVSAVRWTVICVTGGDLGHRCESRVGELVVSVKKSFTLGNCARACGYTTSSIWLVVDCLVTDFGSFLYRETQLRLEHDVC